MYERKGVGEYKLIEPFDCESHSPLQVTVTTLDKRHNKLIFKIHVLEMNQSVLLDFRLSKVSFTRYYFL